MAKATGDASEGTPAGSPRAALARLTASAMQHVLMEQFGSATASALVHRTEAGPAVTVDAFLPALDADLSLAMRSTPDRSIVLVNRRPVEMPDLLAAVRERLVLRHSGFARRFPVILLAVSVPPDALDVNVEPGKQQVLLHDHEAVLSALARILDTLYGPYTPCPDGVAGAPAEMPTDAMLPIIEEQQHEASRTATGAQSPTDDRAAKRRALLPVPVPVRGQRQTCAPATDGAHGGVPDRAPAVPMAACSVDRCLSNGTPTCMSASCDATVALDMGAICAKWRRLVGTDGDRRHRPARRQLALIGPLAAGRLWVVRRDCALLAFSPARADEVGLYARLLESFELPRVPVIPGIPVAPADVGGADAYAFLQSLPCEAVNAVVRRIVDRRITHNGFDVFLRQRTDGTLRVEVGGLCRAIASFGLDDLRETLGTLPGDGLAVADPGRRRLADTRCLTGALRAWQS